MKSARNIGEPDTAQHMARHARGSRPTIGVLAGWQFYWTATPLSYLDPLYRGIRQAAAHHGCNLMLGCGMGTSAAASDPMRPAWPAPSPEADFVPIGPWNTDGLIVVNPLHSAERSRYMAEVRAAGHPVVFVGSGENGPAIVADNAGGIHAAVRHLVEHGHRAIAFVAGSPNDMAGDTGARLDAFTAALRAFDLPIERRHIAYGHHTFAGGQAAMQQIMAAQAPFTAVIASNDESALGAMQALRAAGRAIPGDVALIGFDDRPESAVQSPPLSSVHLPLFQMGAQAVDFLLRQIAGEAELPQAVKVGTRLIPRASCGCAGGGRLLPANATQPVHAAPGDRETGAESIARAMSTAVLTEAHALNAQDVLEFCRLLQAALASALTHDDETPWDAALDTLLERTEGAGDDAQIWQAAIATLADAPASWLPDAPTATQERRAAALLNGARVRIGEAMRRQHRHFVVGERWTMDRIGLLTANLLTARNEEQVFRMLAEHLPAMAIHDAWIAEFDPPGDSALPVPAQSTLRSLTAPASTSRRFATKDFPPPALFSPDEPFSLALLPLVGPRGQHGYVAFDSAHLMLYGAIVQQMAAALNSAQLYREATEGRRLAEEANQMKSRFLSTVSHELRTPLNLIVGTSGILLQESDERDTPLPDQMQRDIARIYGSAQHLTGLIGDVLDLASSDAGELRLVEEIVDLSLVLRMVEETGRRLAAEKGLEWRAEFPAAGAWVRGDRTRLRQIGLNLVSNAVKFTARGAVTLRVESSAGTVTVAVEDTGIGIPPDEQRAIFDEFRRTERSITRGYGGLGLGLAIVRRLVELHGGTIGLYSSGIEGEGTTVHFTLPTVAAPVKAAPPPVNPPAPERVVLVLGVERRAPERLAAHMNLRGFDVQAARPDVPEDWLSQLAAGRFSAVILNIGDAEDAGWRALTKIKENPATQDLPVLFYTAAPQGSAVLELDYLTKPIEVADLTRALDQRWLAADSERPGRVILVVDDDAETLEMHARIVEAHSRSNRVIRARNGREALAILQRVPVDLVLLDLMMPEMDGFGVLAAMHGEPATRDIPVVVVTGRTLTAAEMERLNRGVVSVLGKGLYSLEETLAHLDAALERQRKLSSDAQRLVRLAMAYLHEHYAEPLTRADIARHVGLDEDYLTYCFRQELGVTPIAYLNRYRVNQAKSLLTQTDKSVTFIAQEVGFTDSRYFSRIFRREVGVSPDAFRRA